MNRIHLNSPVGSRGVLIANSWSGSLRFTVINALPEYRNLLLLSGKGLFLRTDDGDMMAFDGEFLYPINRHHSIQGSNKYLGCSIGNVLFLHASDVSDYPAGLRNPGIVEATYGKDSEKLFGSIAGVEGSVQLNRIQSFVRSSFNGTSLLALAQSIPLTILSKSRVVDVSSDELAFDLGQFTIVGSLTERGLCLLNS